MDRSEQISGPNDLSRERVIELSNNKVFMNMTDPFGFVYLKLEKGRLPNHLLGAYLTFDDARQAATSYYTSKSYSVKE